MKTFIAVSFAAALGVTYYFVDKYRSAETAEVVEDSWKRTAVEPETPIRPASFEAMKWNPNDPADVEMRAPASDEDGNPIEDKSATDETKGDVKADKKADKKAGKKSAKVRKKTATE